MRRATRIRRASRGLALLLALSLPVLADAAGLSVQRITPSGDDIPAAQQLVVHFGRPMVPLGHAAPARVGVRIQPRLACQWRWLTPSALACQLDGEHAMAASTRYTVTVEAGWRALDGTRLEREHVHRFVTERPQVDWVGFDTWLAPGIPLLRAAFTQPVSRDSVARHLFIRRDGDGPRLAVRVEASDAAGRAVLAGAAAPEQRARAALLGSRAARVWLLRPASTLGLDRPAALHVEPGLDSGGAESGAERRVVLGFHTFPPFRFLGFSCTGVATGERIEIPAGASPVPRRCDPLAGISLDFSSPAPASSLAAGLRLSPDLAGGRTDYDPWENAATRVYLGQAHEPGRRYRVWLPSALKAYQSYRFTSGPALVDGFKRALVSAVDEPLHTAHRRPRLVLPHPQAVLESGVDSEVPMYVTNLSSVQARFHALDTRGRSEPRSRDTVVPGVRDLAFALPLGVRGMLEGRSGVVSGNLLSVPADRDGGTPFFAQVTPFAVTVKLGHFDTLAWVVDFATGEPVAGARVQIHGGIPSRLPGPGDPLLATATTDAQGIARLPGTQVLDPNLSRINAWRENHPRLLLTVQRDDDMAYLPLSRDYRVWTRQVWPQLKKRLGHLRAWGATAQGIYRLGETVDYKLYVRHQDGDGLVPAPELDYTLRILDPKGQPLGKEQRIRLSPFGAHHGQRKIPDNAAVGWYRFQLQAGAGAYLDAFRVLVSDFTPAPFKVRARTSREAVMPGDELVVVTAATLHAGGPFTGGMARVTMRLRSSPFRSEHPAARGFHFSLDGGAQSTSLADDRGALDQRGERSNTLRVPDGPVINGVLLIESSVRDDRGKSVAARARVRYRARDRLVGLRATGWLYRQDESSRVEMLVVDGDGAPVQGVPIDLRVERQETFTTRVKGAGNAYLERHESRWVESARCDARSSLQAVVCDFVPRAAGRHRFVARIADSREREHRSTLHTYVTGSSRVLWRGAGEGALSIVPEKARYEVGDRARFLIKNPYPGARALISVERYGVLRSFQQRLEGSTPVIELPIEASDAPGFYLGVTLMAPRVAAPPPERGQVDLGKPALRVGYLKVPVSGEPRRLALEVSSDRDTYKPREEVALHFELPPQPGLDASPVELAVVVLDEAVLELLKGGRNLFDPHRGFNRLDGLDVVSFSLLSRLVGRQKFERKGASSGGDGAAQALAVRDLFRYVAYWNPSVVLEDGRASVSFPVPDNLTGWRVLAMAVTPGAGMGLGEARFTVNTPTELRPVMPNQLNAGDRVRGGFSLLNRSDTRRELAVTLKAEGSALVGPITSHRSLWLEPFQRTSLWLDVRSVAPGAIRFSARAGDALDQDALVHEVRVRRVAVREQLAAYGVLESQPAEIPLALGQPARAGSATLNVDVSSSVLSNLDGAFRYMRDYPYACWEQRLSKGTMASHYTRLGEYLDPALTWPAAATLPAATLADAARFQAPNGGMCYWTPRDERVSPYLSAYTALAFGWLAGAGAHIPQEVETRLHAYLDTLLRKEVAPGVYDQGMAATVRAVALAALAQRGALDASQLARYAPHLPRMSLFGKAHFLQAVLDVEGDSERARATLDALLGHVERTPGRITFNEIADAGHARLHSSALRSECAGLGALVRASALPRYGKDLEELSTALARTVVSGRGSRAHFESTQQNLFCMNALAEYARRFESTPVAATVRVWLQQQLLGSGRIQGVRDAPVRLRASPSLAAGDPPQQLRLEREGSGRLYYKALLAFEPADPPSTRTNAGLAIVREVSVRRDGRWQLLASEAAVRRGEVVRVDLYLSVPGRRHFVVVDDPVPGGLEPVDANLATAASEDVGVQLDPRSRRFTRKDWQAYASRFNGFYHRELHHHSVRFFADTLDAGHYHLHYTAQAIAAGRFSVAPVRAEEMYDPEVYGLGLAGQLEVSE